MSLVTFILLLRDSAGSPDTTLTEPHPNSNTHQIKNETANVVFQQHSRKLLKMGILMPETCSVFVSNNSVTDAPNINT